MKLILATSLAVSLMLVACGGGGGSSGSVTDSSVVAGTTISGAAIKGPVAGATVTLKNAATGAVLATTTTNLSGAYSSNIAFSGDVLVEVTGGSYTDEASGTASTLAAPMRVVVSAGGGSVTGIVTPLTSMAYQVAVSSAAALSAGSFNTAAAKLAGQFQLSGVNLATALPLVTGPVNDYGQILRGISRHLQNQNLPLQGLIGAPLTSAQFAALAAGFAGAYSAINPGSTATFSFDGTAFNVSGTGAGAVGTTPSCGVTATGFVAGYGDLFPVSYSYCFSGGAVGSCGSGNSNGPVNQAILGQLGALVSNLSYSYSATCAANAVNIQLP